MGASRIELEPLSGFGSTRTLSITSGKGGVGKSTIVANLAYQLAKENHTVLILDGDLGMANIDIMFGVRPKGTVFNVLSGECELKDVIYKLDEKIYLLPGGSGVAELQNLSDFEKGNLLCQISNLEMHFDYLLIDTAPGIASNVLYLNSAAQEINVVVTPDPASLADSYALIKVLNKQYKETKFSIICNKEIRNEKEALHLYERLSDVADQFLCVSLDFRGYIPVDYHLESATKAQQLVTKVQSSSPSSRAIQTICRNILRVSQDETVKGGLQFFWQQLVGVV